MPLVNLVGKTWVHCKFLIPRVHSCPSQLFAWRVQAQLLPLLLLQHFLPEAAPFELPNLARGVQLPAEKPEQTHMY